MNQRTSEGDYESIENLKKGREGRVKDRRTTSASPPSPHSHTGTAHENDSFSGQRLGLDDKAREISQKIPEERDELKRALLEARAEIRRLRLEANGPTRQHARPDGVATNEHGTATASMSEDKFRGMKKTHVADTGILDDSEPIQGKMASSPSPMTPLDDDGHRVFEFSPQGNNTSSPYGGHQLFDFSPSEVLGSPRRDSGVLQSDIETPRRNGASFDSGSSDQFPGDKNMNSRASEDTGPLNCAIISDPGEDLDDEMAMIMLRYLSGRGFLKCRGVVTNLRPSGDRARLMRGTLDTLGLWEVPVGAGTDGGSKLHEETFCYSADSYIPATNSQRAGCVLPGRALLQRIFTDASPHSIALVCISSLKDAALFMRDNTTLFVTKCHSVVIMGGTEDFDEKDETKFLAPDTAQNNTFDMEASRFLFICCQQLQVPLIVLSRHAAYACPVSRKIYDTMQMTNNPIAGRLRQAQRSSIENLWNRAKAPVGDASRMGLPPRCDVTWFQNSFCGGKTIDGSSCWPYIRTFNMYDPLALLVAVPALREQFFESKKKIIQGVPHLVIGVSKESNGVREPPALHRFMLNAFFQGITADLSTPEEIVVITDAGQEPDDEMTLVLIRHLTELRLVNCLGVIANLRPSKERARLVRGTLDVLGLDQVPVGVGTDGGSTDHVDNFSASAAKYMPLKETNIHLDGQALLHEIYSSAGCSSISLLCLSSLTDAAQFLRQYEALFAQKTKSVTVQGGILPFQAGGFFEPDSAQNDSTDEDSSSFFYRRLQELNIPMIVISRFAVAKCPISRTIYDRMASVGSPIGERLRQNQEDSMQNLWERALMPPNVPERLGLPARCDKSWFLKTFCANMQPEAVPNSQEIWPFVKSFRLYDPMAVLVSIPSLRYRHFDAKTLVVKETEHSLYGISAEEHGVNLEHSKDLMEFMYHSFLKAMTANLSNFDLPKWTLGKTRDVLRQARKKGDSGQGSRSSTGSETSSEAGKSRVLADGYDASLFLGDEPAANLGHEMDTPFFVNDDMGGSALFNFDDMLESLLGEAINEADDKENNEANNKEKDKINNGTKDQEEVVDDTSDELEAEWL